MIGALLNQYRIIASIGAGGMGEVFRARDTRLNRDVAVKVLPKDFVADADRLRRFEQEAKTLAALNHPNVLTIHDAGVHEGAPYLVSELLEGKTLREEMEKGPLLLRKAIDYALQVAQGLSAAHSKGIIHRDLKPENIFVTKDGRVKILDFGLAKLHEPNPRSEIRNPKSAGPDTPTLMDSTEPGRTLGTPAYMSPEQVRGEPADHRSDIFAFGSVLYETLSGTRVFRRNTPVESMNAVLNDEPPELSTLLPNTPAALQRIVERCLQKQPGNRFQSATDLAFALDLKNIDLPGAADRLAVSREKEAPGLLLSFERRVLPAVWKIALPTGAFAIMAMIAVWQPWKKAPTSLPASPQPSAKQAVTDTAHQPLLRAREVCVKGWDASRDEMKLAIALCQSVIERDPADAEAWALSARLNASLYENYDRTLERLNAFQSAARNALSLAPTSLAAQIAQATAYGLEKATHSQSLAILRRLERDAPNDPDVLVALGWRLVVVRTNAAPEPEIFKLFDRALALRPNDPMALNYKAWALTFSGRTTEAEVVWDESIRRTGSPSAMLGRFYDLAMNRGDDKEAKALLAQFPSDLVYNDLAVRLVTQFWLAQREPSKALAFIQPFPREFVEDAFVQIPKAYLVGKAHAQAGQLAAAQFEWRRALDAVNRKLAAQPENPRPLLYKASLHYLLGESDEAARQAETYQQLTSSNDSGTIFLDTLALKMEMGRVQEAVALIENRRKTLESSPRELRPFFNRLRRYSVFYPAAGSAPEFQRELSSIEADVGQAERSGKADGKSEGAAPPDQKSIAVLAFENMSADKENEYFSDGITEEILNALAQTPGLRVAARTSAFSFKGKNESVRRIGEALKVGVVLEGSVQRAGSQLRISTRLVNVTDESLLWSNTFDRKAEDVFAIQTEVAQRVQEALKVKLLAGSAAISTLAGTDNLKAYDLYLRARQFWNLRTGADVQRAVGLFQQATEKDPKFAAAYAGLASSYVVLSEYASLPVRETNPKARAAARRALELDGGLADAHAVLAQCAESDWDWAAAEQEYQEALRLNPNHATSHHWYSLLLAKSGRFTEALAEIRKAQALDPLSAVIQLVIGGTFYDLGQYDETLVEVDKALKLSPDFVPAYKVRGWVFLVQKKIPEAIAEFEKVREKTGDTPYALGYLGLAYARAGQTNQARQILERLKTISASGGAASFAMAHVHLGLGELDQAFAWLERAAESRDADPRPWKHDPILGDVVKDPRYAALLKKFDLDK